MKRFLPIFVAASIAFAPVNFTNCFAEEPTYSKVAEEKDHKDGYSEKFSKAASYAKKSIEKCGKILSENAAIIAATTSVASTAGLTSWNGVNFYKNKTKIMEIAKDPALSIAAKTKAIAKILFFGVKKDLDVNTETSVPAKEEANETSKTSVTTEMPAATAENKEELPDLDANEKISESEQKELNETSATDAVTEVPVPTNEKPNVTLKIDEAFLVRNKDINENERPYEMPEKGEPFYVTMGNLVINKTKALWKNYVGNHEEINKTKPPVVIGTTCKNNGKTCSCGPFGVDVCCRYISNGETKYETLEKGSLTVPLTLGLSISAIFLFTVGKAFTAVANK